MNFLRVAAGLLAVAILSGASLAQAGEPGADHPVFPRYPGAKMEDYSFTEFEEAQVVLSPPTYQGSKVSAKLLPLEGRVTYLNYENPEGSSALQVFRNHQSALKRAGFTDLFTCNRPCGDVHLSHWKDILKARGAYLNGSYDDLFYTAQQNGHVYVSLAVNSMHGKAYTWLFVIEKGALDDQRIAVQGNSPIAQALAQSGRVDLYGFQFDTGKTALKPESAATLKELGQVLKDNPQLTIDVIGHTDDVGTAEANQALSQGRAQAVAAALTAEQGIATDRLFADGRGATQPVAPNASPEGRAKNRRVEIAVHAGSSAPPTAAQARTPATAPPRSQTTATAPPAPPAQPAKSEAESTLNTANQVMEAAQRLKSLFGR